MNAILDPFVLVEAVRSGKKSAEEELLEHLLTEVRHALHGPEGLSEAFFELLPEMQELKTAILKANLANEHKYQHLEDTQDDAQLINEFLAKYERHPEWALLVESASFAVRTMNRITQNLLSHIAGSQFEEFASLKPDDEMLNVNFQRFWDRYIKPAGPSMAKFMSASLMLELCLLAVVDTLSHSNSADVAACKVTELIELTNGNAQVYGAAAIEIGIIATKKPKVLVSTKPMSDEDLASDQYLTELGMAEYLSNLE